MHADSDCKILWQIIEWVSYSVCPRYVQQSFVFSPQTMWRLYVSSFFSVNNYCIPNRNPVFNGRPSSGDCPSYGFLPANTWAEPLDEDALIASTNEKATTIRPFSSLWMKTTYRPRGPGDNLMDPEPSQQGLNSLACKQQNMTMLLIFVLLMYFLS